MKLYWKRIDRVWKLAVLYLGLVIVMIFFLKDTLASDIDNSYFNKNTVRAVKNRNITEKISRPTNIRIPRLDIDLTIAEGKYSRDSNTWTLNNEEAFYAIETNFPNTRAGLTMLYGHNIDNIFHDLVNLQVGDIVYIHTELDDTYIYEYADFKNLKPDDTSLFEYEGGPELHVLTCTNSLPKMRRDMRFVLLGLKAER